MSSCESFAYELMAQADLLRQHPEIGRIVPEYRDPKIREIIFRPYRIVHRVDYEQKLAEIARVWHAARANPEL